MIDTDHGRSLEVYRKTAKIILAVGVATIAAAMVIGPFYSPVEFSWLRHSTSEQAGQHMPGAWVMRVGFLAYGMGTLGAALIDWKTRPWVRAGMALFGLGLIGTAIWSNAPITGSLPADTHEDQIHSVFSGIVGCAFAMASLARLFVPKTDRDDLLAWSGLIVSVLVPLAMGAISDYRGLLQRGMFVFSFFFVLREFDLLQTRDPS